MRLCIGASQEGARLSIGASQVGKGGVAKGHKRRIDKGSHKMKNWWLK